MASDKIDEIEKKKQELEAELERIQGELDRTIDDVRTDVSNKLDPVEFIKKHPLPTVGAAALIGFLAGHRPRRSSGDSSGSTGDGLSSMLWEEMKKLATRKAVSIATDYVEELLEDKTEGDDTSQNGSPDSS